LGTPVHFFVILLACAFLFISLLIYLHVQVSAHEEQELHLNPATSLDAAAVSSTTTSVIVSSFNDSSTHTTPSVMTTNSNSILASSSFIQVITQAVTHQVLQNGEYNWILAY